MGVVELVELGFMSSLAGNAAEVSGLSADMFHCFGTVWSSGTRTSLTNSRYGNLNFRRVIYFRFLSGFYFRSHSYIRDSGGTTASPYV